MNRMFFLLTGLLFSTLPAAAVGGDAPVFPWWGWSLLLLVFCFALGILAVMGGTGGGVLFVPIVGALFPFHIDYVRGAGLIVALTGALSAVPPLLEKRLASLRLALPLSLMGVVGAVTGASVGMMLPTRVIEAALGITILGIVVFMLLVRGSKRSGGDEPKRSLKGVYRDEATGAEVHWTAGRFPAALVLFVIIGFLAGVFGLGAGWANVPVLNLLMGVPLKVSLATSLIILSINDSAAAWVYFNNGAVLPQITIPAAVGMMLGAKLGARLLVKTRPKMLRWMVIILLTVAGLRSILGGLKIL